MISPTATPADTIGRSDQCNQKSASQKRHQPAELLRAWKSPRGGKRQFDESGKQTGKKQICENPRDWPFSRCEKRFVLFICHHFSTIAAPIQRLAQIKSRIPIRYFYIAYCLLDLMYSDLRIRRFCQQLRRRHEIRP